MRAASKPVKRHNFGRRFFSINAVEFGRPISIDAGADTSTTLAGFTIVETLIVLAVTAAMFLLAFVAIGGKQNETEFQQAINDFQSSMQQIVNQVSSGNFQEAKQISCSTGGSGPDISNYTGPNPSSLGTNPDCVFLGKVIQFANQSDPQKYIVYPIAGLRRDPFTLSSCIDIACTNAVLAAPGTAGSTSGFPDTGVQYPMHNGLSISSINFKYYTSPAPSPPSYSSVGAFGIMGGLGSTPGSQQYFLVPISNTQWTNDPANMQNAVNMVDVKLGSSYNAAQTLLNSSNPNYAIEICLASGTTNESGKITIGGNGGNLNSITKTIYGGKNC